MHYGTSAISALSRSRQDECALLTVFKNVHCRHTSRVRSFLSSGTPSLRKPTHMVISVLNTVVTQATVTCAQRPVRFACLAPCVVQRFSSRGSGRLSRSSSDSHFVATTPSLTRAYLGSARQPPAPSLRSCTHFRSGSGSRLRGTIPGSRQAVLHFGCRETRISSSRVEELAARCNRPY